MTHILINADGEPVSLPFSTTYVRDDNGETRPALITGFSPPRRSPNTQFAERGSITVEFNGGPPYRGIDPEKFDLRIIEGEK